MNKKHLILFFLFLFLAFAISFLSFKNKESFEEIISEEETTQYNQLKNVPDEINAIYLTGPYLSNQSRFDKILSLIDETEINAVVIDVKDFSGRIYLNIENNELNKHNALQSWVKMDNIVKRLHEKNVYIIARIAVFEDPILSSNKINLAIKNINGNIWQAYNGLSLADPSSKDVWDYNILVAKEAWKMGFDEINFDYIRFPTDGNLKAISYNLSGKTKIEIINEFYKYLRNELEGIIISADLFGLTTVIDDIGVGQNIEDASKYFDFICPMVYPSHYANGFNGFVDPSEYPYEVVFKSLSIANDKVTNIRPWLQAFDLLGYDYSKEEIQEQIKASKDALLDNYSGYMLWNSQNIYNKEDLPKYKE